MTFRDIVTATKETFHLSPEYFGETVVYTPRGGSSRSINVHVYEEENLELENFDTETRSRVLKIKCLKHAVKGILRPNLGDTIVRDSAHDEDSTPYVYCGEHDNEAVDSWRLHFERKRRDAQGIGGR